MKALLLSKTKMVGNEKEKHGLMLHKLLHMRYCKKKIIQEYSGMDAVMLIYSCLFGIGTRSQLAKHLSCY